MVGDAAKSKILKINENVLNKTKKALNVPDKYKTKEKNERSRMQNQKVMKKDSCTRKESRSIWQANIRPNPKEKQKKGSTKFIEVHIIPRHDEPAEDVRPVKSISFTTKRQNFATLKPGKITVDVKRQDQSKNEDQDNTIRNQKSQRETDDSMLTTTGKKNRKKAMWRRLMSKSDTSLCRTASSADDKNSTTFIGRLGGITSYEANASVGDVRPHPHGMPAPPNQPLPPLPYHQQHLTAPGTCTLPRRGLQRDNNAGKVRSPSNPPPTNRQPLPAHFRGQETSSRDRPPPYEHHMGYRDERQNHEYNIHNPHPDVRGRVYQAPPPPTYGYGSNMAINGSAYDPGAAKPVSSQQLARREEMFAHERINRFSQLSEKYRYEDNAYQPENFRPDNPSLLHIRSEQNLFVPLGRHGDGVSNGGGPPCQGKNNLIHQKNLDLSREVPRHNIDVASHSLWNVRDQDSGFDSMNSRVGESGPRSLNCPNVSHETNNFISTKSTEDLMLSSHLSNLALNSNCGPGTSGYSQSSPRKENVNIYNPSPTSMSQILPSDSIYPPSATNQSYNCQTESVTLCSMNKSGSPRKPFHQNGDMDNEIQHSRLQAARQGIHDEKVVERPFNFRSQLPSEENNVYNGSLSHERFENQRNGNFATDNMDIQLRCSGNASGRVQPITRNHSPEKIQEHSKQDTSVLFIRESNDSKQLLQHTRSFRSPDENEGTFRARQVILTRGMDAQIKREDDPKNDFQSSELHDNIVLSSRRQTFSGTSSGNFMPSSQRSKTEDGRGPPSQREFDDLIFSEEKTRNLGVDNSRQTNRLAEEDFHSNGLTVRDQPSQNRINAATTRGRLVGEDFSRPVAPVGNSRSFHPQGEKKWGESSQPGKMTERESVTREAFPQKDEKVQLRSQNEGCSDNVTPSASWMEWTQQLQAYIAWVNSQLRKKSLPLISDLRRDLQSGVVFADLIDILAGEKVAGIQREPGEFALQTMRDNIDRVLQFMAAKRIKMVQMTSKDVMEGNLKSIMRIILALAAHYKPQSVRCPSHSQKQTDQKNQNIQVGVGLGETASNDADRSAADEGKRTSGMPVSRVPVRQPHARMEKDQNGEMPLAPDKTPNLSALRRGIVGAGATDDPEGCTTPGTLRRQPSLSGSSGIPRPCSPVYENLPRRASSSRWAYDSLRASHKFQWGLGKSAGEFLKSRSPRVQPHDTSEKSSYPDQRNQSPFNASLTTSLNTSFNTSVDTDAEDARASSDSRASNSNQSPSRPAAFTFWQGLLKSGEKIEDHETKMRSGSADGRAFDTSTAAADSNDANDADSPFRYHTIHRMSGRRKLPQIPYNQPGGSGQSSVRGTTPQMGNGDPASPRHQDEAASREPEGRSQNSSPATSLTRGPTHDPWLGRPAGPSTRREEAIQDVLKDLKSTRDHLLALQALDGSAPAEGTARPTVPSSAALKRKAEGLPTAAGDEVTSRVNRGSHAPGALGSKGVREEIGLVREAIGALRTNFRSTDPNQHILDTLEQAIGVLMEKSVAGGGAPVSPADDSHYQCSSGAENGATQTKVIYFTERTVTPFMSTVFKALGQVRLRDFKQVFDRPGLHRYHFKNYDPEYGMVKEEIINDDDILPGVDGKIIAWVQEDRE
ncbi:uncharacterized protein LOC108676477 isoform X2 [Hyalella azteca]|uniref:Uncharacterized protein LOC108676477 isoform X2 n=1 Tax=Hyalella azteca TaxID=294128 RepID=A0A979FP63_HYAAZ|nr:uncharacterized protein LOC108676477 isoform X2 [Hyalella azteca]